MLPILLAGLVYFGLVFAAGVVLGTIRVLLLAPRVGEHAAELAETPLMLVASLFAARWVVRRFRIPTGARRRLPVGLVALALLLLGELLVFWLVRGVSLGEYVGSRDPLAGSVYLVALAMFALMPWLVGLGARRVAVLVAALWALPAGACATAAREPEPGELLVDEPLGVRLRYLPVATVSIGSPESEVGRDADEVLHRAELTRGVWMMEGEVTQALWWEVMNSSPSLFAACGADCPVERVSWYDALELANRLSERAGLEPCYRLGGCRGVPGGGCPGGDDWCHGDFVCERVELAGLDCAGYRLPTESEWEHAARAGTSSATWVGAVKIVGLNDAPGLDPLAWYGGNSGVEYAPAWDCSHWPERQLPAPRCGTHPVGLKRANPWGFADILGNVWEWVWDRYGPYPEGPVTDPTGPETGADRVRRGCSWASISRHCRAADRNRERPADRDRNWGVRLVRGGC